MHENETLIFTEDTPEVLIQIRTTEDGLKAFAQCSPKIHSNITDKLIYGLLTKHISGSLLHDDVIQEITMHLKKGESVAERRIAKGIPAIDGADGKFVLLCRKIKTENGRVLVSDHRGLLELESIKKGQVIARLYHPRSGVHGKSVTGKVLNPKIGKDVELSLHSSLSINHTSFGYSELIANSYGFLSEEKNSIVLFEKLIFEGDFDPRLGPITFNGSIEVRGDVKPNSFITADRDIEIRGNVFNHVTLKSEHGFVKIKGAIKGQHSAEIFGFQGVEISIATNANFKSEKNIIVQNELLECNCHSLGWIIAEKGQIVGGEHTISGGIYSNIIGNNGGIKTSIHLTPVLNSNINPQIENSIQSHEQALKLLEMHLGNYLHSDLNGVNESQKIKLKVLKDKYYTVKKSLDLIIDEKLKSNIQLPQNGTGTVSVSGKIFPGTVIFCGSKIWSTPTNIRENLSVCYDSKTHNITEQPLIKYPEGEI